MKTKQSTKLFATIIGLAIFTFCNLSSMAQEATTELLIGKTLFDVRVKFAEDLYTISLDSNGASSTNSITVTSFTSSVFKNYVISIMESKTKSTFVPDDTMKMRLNLRYIELMAALFNIDQKGQRIATIELKKRSVINTKELIHSTDTISIDTVSTDTIWIHVKSKTHHYTIDSLKIIDAQIVFEDGFIKSVIVKGTFGNNVCYFSNKYPIGITTRKNILDLGRVRLYNEIRWGKEYIYLGDAITYKRELGVRTNDYSPANQKVIVTKNDKNGIILKKTPSQEIFTLNIFSDFVGINASNPNGLIQTEISKRINFWTKRIRFLGIGGIGMFTHIAPVLEISKIEENNRYMPFLNQSIDISNTNYANPLQVLRYSTANVRTELNLIDIQTAALTFNFNFLAGVAVTKVKDSAFIQSKLTFVDETINSFGYGANAKFIFNPESKWSYTMTGTYLKVNNLNDKFLYRTINNGVLTNSSSDILSGELLVAWNTTKDNKLFGRFRYNWESNNVYNNYSQFQVGFSKKFKSSKSE
tara:strand:- start:48723 stop:50309 length:1587 start_codon:yes stop_codon:yes gene_type:complete